MGQFARFSSDGKVITTPFRFSVCQCKEKHRFKINVIGGRATAWFSNSHGGPRHEYNLGAKNPGHGPMILEAFGLAAKSL